MCGIAGIVNGNVNEIICKLGHRGPDFMGSLSQDSPGYKVEFAHARLSIIDTSPAGNQPMQLGNLAMTYNGEIYNYKELSSFYVKNDDLGTSTIPGDSITLLRHIANKGIDQALRDINGMFAIGLWNKSTETITLAVDRFGQKPLYYYSDETVFAFASSPHALLHLKPKWKINKQAIDGYWKLGAVMTDSVFDGIKKLNASEKVTYCIRSKQIKTELYWKPEYQSNTSGITDLILDSIKKVKVADVPVYIFLSGGIDSSTVASQFSGGHAIHLNGPEYVYAKEVSDRFNITLHNVCPSGFDMTEILKDYIEKTGEPTMSGGTPWMVAKEAAKLCKVAVSANGADELFFGYERTTDKVTRNQYNHIFRDLPGEVTYPEIDPRLSNGRWLELMTYVQHDLNRSLDFASMCHSLEVRNPFLDHRLVEMALSIPQDRHGKKVILKNILKSYGFTDQFLNRPKMGFSLYVKPDGLDHLRKSSLRWAEENGFVTLPRKLSTRDRAYLEYAAPGFKIWYETYKSILE